MATLRRLYLARFAFALTWALALLTTASDLGPLAAALIVLYPLVDAAAAAVDARSTSSTGPLPLLRVNLAVSLLAAVGLAVAGAAGIPAVLRGWGAWAIVAGAVQLGVAVARRGTGGQWPMVLSGGLSVLAGGSFLTTAGADVPTLTPVAGYAVLGGVFFLVAALRLGRTRSTQRV